MAHTKRGNANFGLARLQQLLKTALQAVGQFEGLAGKRDADWPGCVNLIWPHLLL